MSLGTYPAVHGGREEVVLNFRFQVNGTSDPDFIVQSNGFVTDIAYAATGVFTCTLASNHRYQALISYNAKLQDDLANDIELTSYTQSTGAVVLQGFDRETPAATVPTDDTWVHVTLVFCRRNDFAQVRGI